MGYRTTFLWLRLDSKGHGVGVDTPTIIIRQYSWLIDWTLSWLWWVNELSLNHKSATCTLHSAHSSDYCHQNRHLLAANCGVKIAPIPTLYHHSTKTIMDSALWQVFYYLANKGLDFFTQQKITCFAYAHRHLVCWLSKSPLILVICSSVCHPRNLSCAIICFVSNNDICFIARWRGILYVYFTELISHSSIALMYIVVCEEALHSSGGWFLELYVFPEILPTLAKVSPKSCINFL